MKKILRYTLAALLALPFCGCEQSIDGFDNDTNYIQFNMPYVTDVYGRPTKVRVDSLVYSFALEDRSVTNYTFKVPVNTMGLAHNADRSYRLEVVADQTTATDADWSKSVIDNPVIKAGKLVDTLLITVNRTPQIATGWSTIVLRLLPNEHFETGVEALQTAKLTYTDMLIAPDWWNTWDRYFGDFVKEKFLKWQEIYYLGADPNAPSSGPNAGVPYYWDNMPTSTYGNTVTYMYIRILKQYFIDNEVYPDGDTSKPRITLP